MEGLYIFLIIAGLFIIFAVVIMTVYMKMNAKKLKSEECKKDGEQWLKLMKIFYKHQTIEATAEGIKSPEYCLAIALEIEKKYSTNPEIPSVWRDKELIELIDSHASVMPSNSNNTNDFNTKRAIIGGALGGITGAYIGSHIKKKSDKD